MIFPFIIIAALVGGAAIEQGHIKESEEEQARDVKTTRVLEREMTKLQKRADYSAREEILTKEKYCETMRYGVEVCWDISRAE